MTKTDKFFAVFLSVLFAAFVLYTTYITGYRCGHNECRLKIETNYNERLQGFVKMTQRAKEGYEEMREQYEQQLQEMSQRRYAGIREEPSVSTQEKPKLGWEQLPGGVWQYNYGTLLPVETKPINQ